MAIDNFISGAKTGQPANMAPINVPMPAQRPPTPEEIAKKAAERQGLLQPGGSRGIDVGAFPKAKEAPGVEELARAGVGEAAVNTGLSSEQEALFLLGQQIRQGDPFRQSTIDELTRLSQITGQQLPGIQEWQKERLADLEGREAGSLAALTGARGTQAGALEQLQALMGGSAVQTAQGALGQTGLALSPEVRAMVERERQLGLERARGDIFRGFEEQEAGLQARLAARGLGASEISAGAGADLASERLRQLEQARLSGEQQALQREMGLRQLSLGERGQTIQGALGLGGFQAGVAGQQLTGGLQQQQLEQSQLAQLAGLIQQQSPAAQLQTQLALASTPLQLQQRFSQQDIANQLATLGVQPGGGGGGGPSQVASTVGGALSGAGIGHQIYPGWGTAIGSVVGGAAGYFS